MAWRNALVGLRRLPAGSALHARAVERAFESLLEAVEKAAQDGGGGAAAPRESPQIEFVLRYLHSQEAGIASDLESLARDLVASAWLDVRSRGQAMSVLLDAEPELAALHARCAAVGLESVFWSRVGTRLLESEPCAVQETWLSWTRESDVANLYSAFLARRLHGRQATATDFTPLMGLLRAVEHADDLACAGAPGLVEAIPSLLARGDLPTLLGELDSRVTGSEREAALARALVDAAGKLGPSRSRGNR